MPGLAAPEAWAWVANGVVVLPLTEVAALLGFFLDTIFSDVALLETSETLYHVLLTLVVWLTVFKISCRSFSLRGFLPFLFFLLFFFINVQWIVAWKTSIHDPLQKCMLLLYFPILFRLNVLNLWVDAPLDVHFTHILGAFFAFNFIRKEGSVAWNCLWILLFCCFNYQQSIWVINGFWGLINDIFSRLFCFHHCGRYFFEIKDSGNVGFDFMVIWGVYGSPRVTAAFLYFLIGFVMVVVGAGEDVNDGWGVSFWELFVVEFLFFGLDLWLEGHGVEALNFETYNCLVINVEVYGLINLRYYKLKGVDWLG